VLTSWIAPRNNPYATSPDDQQKIKSLLEQATFQRAQCMTRLSEPAEKVAEYREQAIKLYDVFVKMFEKSALAPKALSGKGTIYLELKRFDDAARTFDELAARYPDSEEGKNALFSLARAAMEIKQFDQGVSAFERMMHDSARYQPEEFVRLGAMMSDAAYAEQAIRAFREAQSKIASLPADQQESSRPVIERSLFGIARAYQTSGQHAEAVKAIDDLLNRFPKSGLYYDAKFLQGEAYRDSAKYPAAVQALSDVFKYASDSALINRATMTLAEIQRKHGDKTEALASYQRVALLTDRTKPDDRSFIEDALLASVEVAMELGRFRDVITNADEYETLFPDGRYKEAIRSARRDAVMKSAAGGALPPSGDQKQ